MKPNMGEIAGKVFGIVANLEKDEVAKVLKAVSALVGLDSTETPHTPTPLPIQHQSNPSNEAIEIDALRFFTDKSPRSKSEALAVAARFREIHLKEKLHTKSDFVTVFDEARRNFDEKNFGFDIQNAKKINLFVKSSSVSHSHQLSYMGQNLVDALPDYELADSIKKSNAKSSGANRKKSR